MSTINVKITDTGWLLTKGDKSISIKDNGDGKLANGDELSSELSGSGFTQQDILLVANELNNPQSQAAVGKKKGNFWGNLQGFMNGFMGGISSMFTLGGLFGFGGGFWGGQDSWAFNGCGGVGFNDMRVWNYGLNSMWSGDIGYTGSTQGAYAVLNSAGLGNIPGGLGGMNGLYGNGNPYGLYGNPNAGLELTVAKNQDTGNNGNNNGAEESTAGSENSRRTVNSNTTDQSVNANDENNGNNNGADNGATGAGNGQRTGDGAQSGKTGNGNGNNDNTDANGNGNGSGNKKTGPRFYTGNDADIAAANNGNGSGAGGRRSITD